MRLTEHSRLEEVMENLKGYYQQLGGSAQINFMQVAKELRGDLSTLTYRDCNRPLHFNISSAKYQEMYGFMLAQLLVSAVRDGITSIPAESKGMSARERASLNRIKDLAIFLENEGLIVEVIPPPMQQPGLDRYYTPQRIGVESVVRAYLNNVRNSMLH